MRKDKGDILAAFEELEELAIGERLGKLPHHASHLGAVGTSHIEHTQGREIVARKDGNLVAEGGVDGGLSAADGAVVDDVVVHQAGGVDELER